MDTYQCLKYMITHFLFGCVPEHMGEVFLSEAEVKQCSFQQWTRSVGGVLSKRGNFVLQSKLQNMILSLETIKK